MARWRGPTIQGYLGSVRLAYTPLFPLLYVNPRGISFTALQRSPTTPSQAVFLGINAFLRATIDGPSARLATLRLIQLTFAQVEVSLFSSPSSQPPIILLHRRCKEAILSPR